VGITLHVKHRYRYNRSLKNNRAITTTAIAIFASLFFYSPSLSDLESAYGSLRRGSGFTGGGEGRLPGPDGFQGGGANIPNSLNIPNNNPSSPIISGQTRDNFGHGPVGPHGPYGPGPVGPRESRNIDDNTITRNNIYAPRTLEGPVIVNPQPAPTTTETPSQTDITVEPTTTEEEQQQTDNNNDGQSTSTETQDQIPIANAGPSLTVQPSSNAVLDGTKSYDPNGDSLQFLWLQLAGGPAVSLLKNTTATPSFIAPSLPNITTLTFQLIVSDGQTDSTPAYTYVTVQP
jgi:hypothetical protein